MFFRGHGSRFTGSTAGNEGVNPIFDLIFHQLFNFIPSDIAAFIEGVTRAVPAPVKSSSFIVDDYLRIQFNRNSPSYRAALPSAERLPQLHAACYEKDTQIYSHTGCRDAACQRKLPYRLPDPGPIWAEACCPL